MDDSFWDSSRWLKAHMICNLPRDYVVGPMEPGEIQILKNPSAQVLLYERAANAIMALINSKPSSPTREEIIAALKGVGN